MSVYNTNQSKWEYRDNYWTSSEYSGNEAFRMNLGSVEPNKANNPTVWYATYLSFRLHHEGPSLPGILIRLT